MSQESIQLNLFCDADAMPAKARSKPKGGSGKGGSGKGGSGKGNTYRA